jgi:soluble lytic murein transglycosylase-like protein
MSIKYTKLLSFIILPLLAMPQPVNTNAEIREPQIWVNPQPKAVIEKYASENNIDPRLLEQLMRCESGGNKDAINRKDPNGGSYGIMQYQKSTWEYFEKKYGEDLDFQSYHDQIKMTAIAVADGQGSHWTCYRKIKH